VMLRLLSEPTKMRRSRPKHYFTARPHNQSANATQLVSTQIPAVANVSIVA
jgi:hypothetical protein